MSHRARPAALTTARAAVALSVVLTAFVLSSVSAGCTNHHVSGPKQLRLPEVKTCQPQHESHPKQSLSLLSPAEASFGNGVNRAGWTEMAVSEPPIAWSKDSKQIGVLSSSGVVSVWDTSTGKLVALRANLPGDAEQLVFDRDGKSIDVASVRGAWRYRLDGGAATLKFDNAYAPQKPVWSPDGSLLLATSSAGPRLVDGSNGAVLGGLDLPSTELNSVYPLTSLGWFASDTALDRHTVWDWSSLKPITSFSDRSFFPIQTLSQSPDQRWAAVVSSARVLLINRQSQKRAAELSIHPDLRLLSGQDLRRGLCAWSSNASQFAFVPQKDKEVVYAIELRDEAPSLSARIKGMTRIEQILWEDDGRTLVVRGVPSTATLKRVAPRTLAVEQRWQLDAAQPRIKEPTESTKTKKPPKPAGASKTNKPKKPATEPPVETPELIQSGAELPTVGMVTEPVATDNPELVKAIANEANASPCQAVVSPDGTLSALHIQRPQRYSSSVVSQGRVSVRETATGKERFSVGPRALELGGVVDLVPAPTADPVFALQTRSHGMFAIEKSKLIPIDQPTTPSRLAWQSGGQALAGAGPGWLRMWDRKQDWQYRDHRNDVKADTSVTRMVWGNDTTIAIVQANKTEASVGIWNTELGWQGELSTYDAEVAESSAELRMGHDGLLYVAMGSVLEIWNVRTKTRVSTQSFAVDRIKGLSPDLSKVVAESESSLVVIDRSTGKSLSRLADPGNTTNALGKRALTFSADGANLAGVIGEDGTWRTRAWRLADGVLLAEITGGGVAPKARWLWGSSDLVVAKQESVEVVHLADCSDAEISLLRLDGRGALVVEDSTGRFDASDDALWALSLNVERNDERQRFLLGETLRAQRRAGLLPWLRLSP
ncbi:MAG: hypothetical protein U0165_00240 [Polyangiaceae bacterium]